MVNIKKLISILMVMTILMGTFFAFPASALKENPNTVKFKSDGTFKIMQMSDLQDGTLMMPITKSFINDLIESEKPDLIVLTGDNVTGGALKSGIRSVDQIMAMRAIGNFMKVFQKHDVPVASVFGNHDAEKTMVDKEAQMKIYMKYPNFVGIDEGVDLSGCGTYNIPIMSSTEEKVKFNLWMFDSGMYDEINGGYDHVKQDQLDWYVKKSNELKANNGGNAVPSIAFQHIIVPEIFDLLKQVPAGTKDAVKKGEKFYVFEEQYLVSGVLGEAPCPSSYNSGQFDTLANQGDVLAMFFGHDHVNTFVAKHPLGVDLATSPGTGFASYGDDNRGVRVITLNEADTSKYSEEVITYLDFYSGDKTANARFVLYAGEYPVLERVVAAVKYIYYFITDLF